MNKKTSTKIAKCMTFIAGNVAHVALLDSGAISHHILPSRADACKKIKELEKEITELLTTE